MKWPLVRTKKAVLLAIVGIGVTALASWAALSSDYIKVGYINGDTPWLMLRRLAKALLAGGIPKDELTMLADSDDPFALKVLFIGNSLTFCNQLPVTFIEIVQGADPKRQLKIGQLVAPGLLLEDHWLQGTALKAIRARGPWDYVVLQAGSTEPIVDKACLFQYVSLFNNEIKKHGGKTVLVETWSDKDMPLAQRVISCAYQDMADRFGVVLAPVGDAWLNTRNHDRQIELYAQDRHHPGAAGTYLAACTIYATVLRHSPEGTLSKSVPEPVARFLQRESWRAVGHAR